MPLIEAGHWIANQSEDLSRPRYWMAERRTPGFPDDVLAEACAVVAEPSLRASAMDVAPDFVAGLIQNRQNITTFCLQVTSYAQVALWLASTRSPANGHDLIRFWLHAVSSNFVNEFTWTAPVDTAALRLPVLDRAAPAVLRIPYRDRRIAVREHDRERRLRLCCDIFDRLWLQARPSMARSLVLVDGLTVVRGDKFQVAGLVAAHRYAGSDWIVLDHATPSVSRMALARFCNTISGTSRTPRGSRPDACFVDPAALAPSSEPPHRPEPERIPTTSDRFRETPLSRDVIAQVLSAVTSYVAALAGSERALFEQPDRLAGKSPGIIGSSSLSPGVFDVVARALIISRFPALALDLSDAFTDWLETVIGFDIELHAFVLSEVAQSLYDHCRRHADAGDTAKILFGLDRLVDHLVEMVEALPDALPNGALPSDPVSHANRQVLVDSFDRLSELETTSLQRDRQLLRAGMIVRLVAGLPTPDVVDRAVRFALIENSPIIRNLISRSRWAAALTEVAAAAVADVRGEPLDEGRRVLAGMVSFTGEALAASNASEASRGNMEPATGNRAISPVFNSFRLGR